MEVEVRTINGKPGIVATAQGEPTMALALAIAEERISRVWVIVNPRKLAVLASEPIL